MVIFEDTAIQLGVEVALNQLLGMFTSTEAVYVRTAFEGRKVATELWNDLTQLNVVPMETSDTNGDSGDFETLEANTVQYLKDIYR